MTLVHAMERLDEGSAAFFIARPAAATGTPVLAYVLSLQTVLAGAVYMTQEYTINVQEVEELQTIGDRDALELLFDRARRTVIGGGIVVLVRRSPGGEEARFDELSTEADLDQYRQQVFRYLN